MRMFNEIKESLLTINDSALRHRKMLSEVNFAYRSDKFYEIKEALEKIFTDLSFCRDKIKAQCNPIEAFYLNTIYVSIYTVAQESLQIFKPELIKSKELGVLIFLSDMRSDALSSSPHSFLNCNGAGCQPPAGTAVDPEGRTVLYSQFKLPGAI